MKNYYIQILTFIALVNNNISSFMMGYDGYHTAMSGNQGWPKYWHYWLVFDYRSQLMIYLIGILMAIKYPLDGLYKKFATISALMYISIFAFEIMIYLWDGNDARNEKLVPVYLFGYTVANILVAKYLKIWKI